MSQAIRVVHVIARMNVGGPAILISDIVRELDREEFDVRLITGNCGDDEADYLETQASRSSSTPPTSEVRDDDPTFTTIRVADAIDSRTSLIVVSPGVMSRMQSVVTPPWPRHRNVATQRRIPIEHNGIFAHADHHRRSGLGSLTTPPYERLGAG